jgi:integrase
MPRASEVGRNTRPKADGIPTILTVRHLLGFWKGTVVPRFASSETRRSRTIHVATLARVVGEVPIATLGPLTVERFISHRLGEGIAPSTINCEIRTFKRAVQWGREIDDNVPEVRFPKRLHEVPVRSKRTPSDAEARAVLDKMYGGYPHLAFRVLMETGCRPFELAIRPRDVTLETPDEAKDPIGWVFIRGKNHRERWVPISLQLGQELLAWAEEREVPQDGELFGVKRSTLVRRVRAEIKKACVRAEVEHFHPYGLRRAMDDRLGRGGVGPDLWGAHMGHSPEMALRRYRQVTRDDLRRVVPVSTGRVINVDFKKRSGE